MKERAGDREGGWGPILASHQEPVITDPLLDN